VIFDKFFGHDSFPHKIGRQYRTLQVKIYSNFYIHVDRNSLNIYWSETRFEERLKTKMKHTFHAQHTFTTTK